MLTAEVFRMGEYHKVAANWWLQHHKSPLTVGLLARLGIVILDDGDPVALTHIYPSTTSAIAWVGFTVVAPHISKYRAGKALKLLLIEAEEAIRRLGYSVVYTGFDSPALQKLCQRSGYEPGSQVLEQFKVLRR